MDIRKIITSDLGVDGAVFYTLLGRIVQIVTAVFTIFFITKYLSPEEQGYYYTFGSIVALQVFFELGLSGIITQFVAHEASHLRWNSNSSFIGESSFRSRLSSLLHFCIKWYLIFAILIIIVLFVTGIFFFSRYNSDDGTIVWKMPWVLLVIGTALNFLIAPISSFIEGLGKVKEIAQIRLVQQLFNPIIIWGGLVLGSRLFVSGAYSVVSVLVFILIIFKSSSWKMLVSIYKEPVHETIGYKEEIFPLQWRIAVSWISGYFIFQLFNPVLFATEGSVVAGQMGMTMSALNALTALTQSWISTKVPIMSGQIAMKDYTALDKLFSKTMRQTLIIGTIVLFAFVFVIVFIQKHKIAPAGINIGERFLDVLPLCLMACSIWTLFPINCWATYLRCHKREPLMWNSMVVGLSCGAAILITGRIWGLIGICISFALLRIVSLIWIYCIYERKRKEWHGC